MGQTWTRPGYVQKGTEPEGPQFMSPYLGTDQVKEPVHILLLAVAIHRSQWKSWQPSLATMTWYAAGDPRWVPPTESALSTSGGSPFSCLTQIQSSGFLCPQEGEQRPHIKTGLAPIQGSALEQLQHLSKEGGPARKPGRVKGI